MELIRMRVTDEQFCTYAANTLDNMKTVQDMKTLRKYSDSILHIWSQADTDDRQTLAEKVNAEYIDIRNKLRQGNSNDT